MRTCYPGPYAGTCRLQTANKVRVCGCIVQSSALVCYCQENVACAFLCYVTPAVLLLHILT